MKYDYNNEKANDNTTSSARKGFWDGLELVIPEWKRVATTHLNLLVNMSIHDLSLNENDVRTVYLVKGECSSLPFIKGSFNSLVRIFPVHVTRNTLSERKLSVFKQKADDSNAPAEFDFLLIQPILDDDTYGAMFPFGIVTGKFNTPYNGGVTITNEKNEYIIICAPASHDVT